MNKSTLYRILVPILLATSIYAENAVPYSGELPPVLAHEALAKNPYACETQELMQFSNKRYANASIASDYSYLWLADTKTIKINKKDKIIKIWLVSITPEEKKQVVYTDAGYVKHFILLDYDNYRVKSVEIIPYSCAGNPLRSHSASNTWSEIAPNSVMEEILENIKYTYKLK